MAVLQSVGYHVHLLSMLGCVTRDEPLCLVTEFCANGDLLHVVRHYADARDAVVLSPRRARAHRFCVICRTLLRRASSLPTTFSHSHGK